MLLPHYRFKGNRTVFACGDNEIIHQSKDTYFRACLDLYYDFFIVILSETKHISHLHRLRSNKTINREQVTLTLAETGIIRI